MCLTDCVTKRWCVKHGQRYHAGIFDESAFCFPPVVAGVGRLLSSRVIFLRQWTGRKQSSKMEHCFPLTHFLRKITKPLSSPLEVFEDFFGADAEKQRSFRGCFPRIHTPSKTAGIVAGMIGKFRKMACHFAPDAPCPGTS